MAHFLDLPRELRDQVYRELLVRPRVIIQDRRIHHPTSGRSHWMGIIHNIRGGRRVVQNRGIETYEIRRDERCNNPEIQLLRVCREINREASQLFYVENSFAFETKLTPEERLPFATPPSVVAMHFLGDRSESVLRSIRSVEVRLDTESSCTQPLEWRVDHDQIPLCSNAILALWETFMRMELRNLALHFHVHKQDLEGFIKRMTTSDAAWINQIQKIQTLQNLSLTWSTKPEDNPVPLINEGLTSRGELMFPSFEIAVRSPDRTISIYSEEYAPKGATLNDLTRLLRTVAAKIAPQSLYHTIQHCPPTGQLQFWGKVVRTRYRDIRVDEQFRHRLWLGISSESKCKVSPDLEEPEAPKERHATELLKFRNQDCIPGSIFGRRIPDNAPYDTFEEDEDHTLYDVFGLVDRESEDEDDPVLDSREVYITSDLLRF
ncbi:hypothetical protein NA57DRAFT_76561 [Rhizodiscina lignyota]|uniref:DUF7730 domain-containing protein n=1 Tax=Rhizodiscina lignyota TaxID=1504668 RepID=A0A9P4M7X3_9PEZI|nr:hypothetical protein NA57DRAFT_76561 [Rhizodiscina lignyota]